MSFGVYSGNLPWKRIFGFPESVSIGESPF